MNIGVFAYNFPHWKTQEGVHNLILKGFKPKVILAADPVPLNFPHSQIRISPKDLYLTHPQEIAKYHNIDYHIVKHNSQTTSDLVKQYDLDVGVILGARILKPIAFSNFKTGVLNLHPGILPQNRGLDNIKWAIIDNLPQGVTTHLINEKIDMGFFIEQENSNVYPDDTLLDLHLRIQNLEQKLMISSLKILHKNSKNLLPLSKGNYYKAVPLDIEKTLLTKFKTYKNKCQ
jgi:phosphoribosylglycinamide formyltransferase-1